MDEDSGRAVLVRFIWQRRGADQASCAQARSLDGGRSREHYWRMESTRQ